MPPHKKYASLKQERFANSPTGKAKLGEAEVEGKNKASKGAKLPLVSRGSGHRVAPRGGR